MHSLKKDSKPLSKWRLPKDKNYQSRIKQYSGAFTAEGILTHLEEVKKTRSANTYNLSVFAFRELIKINLGKKYSLEKINTFLASMKPVKQNSQAITGDKVLDKVEIKHLLKKIEDKPRQHTLIKFLASTGCRISEAVKIRMKSISTSGDYSRIEIIGKWNKQRTIFITKELLKEIKDAYKSNVFLFQREKSVVKQSGEVGHITRQYVFKLLRSYSERKFPIIEKRISPHTFRHSFGTNAIQAQKPLKAVSKYLGHSDTNITNKFYVHTEFNGEDLKDLMKF